MITNKRTVGLDIGLDQPADITPTGQQRGAHVMGAAAPTQLTDPYIGAAPRIADEQRLRARRNLLAAANADPIRTARALELAAQTGLPVDLVERNLDRLQARVDDERHARIVTNSPALQYWFGAEPVNARIARHDMDRLGGVVEAWAALWDDPQPSALNSLGAQVAMLAMAALSRDRTEAVLRAVVSQGGPRHVLVPVAAMRDYLDTLPSDEAVALPRRWGLTGKLGPLPPSASSDDVPSGVRPRDAGVAKPSSPSRTESDTDESGHDTRSAHADVDNAPLPETRGGPDTEMSGMAEGSTLANIRNASPPPSLEPDEIETGSPLPSNADPDGGPNPDDPAEIAIPIETYLARIHPDAGGAFLGRIRLDVPFPTIQGISGSDDIHEAQAPAGRPGAPCLPTLISSTEEAVLPCAPMRGGGGGGSARGSGGGARGSGRTPRGKEPAPSRESAPPRASEPAAQPSTSALGRALGRAGVRRPADTHAHHIVAQNDARASASREILRRFGINIDDAANGVFLHKPYHQGLHSEAYHRSVERMLSMARSRNDVENILDKIRRNLLVQGGTK